MIGQSPWESERIRQELWHRGIWSWRQHTACFAYPGIDMALWDICGKASSQPLYNLFGGRVRESASYFYYCSQGSPDHIACAGAGGRRKGIQGLLFEGRVKYRGGTGDGPVSSLSHRATEQRFDLDANGAWKVNEALRNLAKLDKYKIDLLSSPSFRIRSRTCRRSGTLPVAISANEGLWTAADAYRQMAARTADVYCFSPYFTGSLAQFQRLSWPAHLEGLQICRHTHGELGITATACHHILLTLPNVSMAISRRRM